MVCTFFINVRSDFDYESCKRDLEANEIKYKTKALYSLLTAIGQNEEDAMSAKGLLIAVIRFAMPCKDKLVKKLVLLYLENIQKYEPDGQLKSEMILVCNGIRNDIQHPNEYFRGFALRFLCRLREPEIVEPLLPSARSCLNHPHPYVRKSAIVSILNVSQHIPHLVPDAFEIIQEALERESDNSCLTAAIAALCRLDRRRVLGHLNDSRFIEANLSKLVAEVPLSQIASLSEGLLVLALNSTSSIDRFSILNSFYQDNHYCLEESADLLGKVFQYTLSLAANESSQPLKSLAVHFLRDFSTKFALYAPKSFLLDLIALMSSANIDIGSRIFLLSLCQLFLEESNAQQLFLAIAKLLKCTNSNVSKIVEAEFVVSVLNCLEVTLKHPIPREVIIEGLTESVLCSLKHVKQYGKVASVFSNLLNVIMSSFTEQDSSVIICSCLQCLMHAPTFSSKVLETLLTASSEFPFLLESIFNTFEATDLTMNIIKHSLVPKGRIKVLQDGTYGYDDEGTQIPDSDGLTPIDILNIFRTFSLFFSRVFMKTSLRRGMGEMKAKILVKLTKTLKTCSSHLDNEDRNLLSELLNLIKMLASKMDVVSAKTFTPPKAFQVESSPTTFRQDITSFCECSSLNLVFKQSSSMSDPEDNIAKSRKYLLSKAKLASPRLEHLIQMTGFTDPIYVESFITLEKDLVNIDLLVVNQTPDSTFTNIQVDFALPGKMKLIEHSKPLNLTPSQFSFMKYVIRSSSQDCASSIYSTISFSSLTSAHSNSVLLEEIMTLDPIVIPITDFIIKPDSITFDDFSAKWQRLEWENKITIVPSTRFHSIEQFLSAILSVTKMQIQANSSQFPSSEVEFFSTNIYAKSIFDDDICANISLEKTMSSGVGMLYGHIRLRCQSQSVALALGDTIHSIVA